MRKYGLSFIKDIDLYNHVAEVVAAYSFNIDLRKFNENLIDPIKLTFDSYVYNQTIKDTIEAEVIRQLDKTNSNTIGYFHQNIFKYIGVDWSVPQTGYDIVNSKQKIYCELKNKHNTMNSSSSAKTFMRMQSTLISDPSALCMLVEVIAPHSRDIPWVVTLDGQKQEPNNNIRRVSIDKLYSRVIGADDAFLKLCEVLPVVISDVVRSKGSKVKQNSVMQELKGKSLDVLTSVYLLAFEKYEGFSNFKIKK
ncbi:MAG: Eco47II family restriction endonuclease [Rikenellaceae bacterium]